MKPYGIIYMFTNKINNKKYIGKTTQNIEIRISQHKYKAKHYKKKNIHFYNALLKYGIENFDIDIIFEAKTEFELNYREIYYIALYNTCYGDGYNSTEGGEGCKCNQETRKRISESRKGMSFSQEHKKALSEVGKGRKHSKETKEKISKALKGKKAHNKGKKLSDETKKKISKKMKGYKQSKEHIEKRTELKRKKVRMYEYKTNKFICEFESIAKATEEMNLQRPNVIKVLKGERNHCGGYYFEYVEL